MKHTKPKLEIKTRRIFSEGFKRSKVEELIQKRITIRQLSKIYEVSPSAVYSWLYKYSVHYEQRSKLVVEMESESYRTQQLLQRVAELERIIGQKQLEVDFLNKLLEIGSEELGFDLKKNFSTKLSSGTGGSAGGEGSK